jgi:hypothetical protein
MVSPILLFSSLIILRIYHTPLHFSYQITFFNFILSLNIVVRLLEKIGHELYSRKSTGVFWKPIVNLLEVEDIEFLVVNAQHMKALPGRKTDVKDCRMDCPTSL